MNKKIKILKWIFFSLMIIINAFIIYQSCLPEVSSKSWSEAVVDVIKVITNGSVSGDDPVTPTLSFGKLIRKIVGHFSLFMVDGVITYLYFYYLNKDKNFKNKWMYILPALAIGILLAVITESIQLITPGRVGDIVDILIDIGGYLFGAGVTYLIIYLLNWHKNKKPLEENINNK